VGRLEHAIGKVKKAAVQALRDGPHAACAKSTREQVVMVRVIIEFPRKS
jgi:hypothetical protein